MPKPAALAAIGLLAIAAPVAWAAAAPDEIPASLDWDVRTTDVQAPTGKVELSLSYHTAHQSSNFGREFSLGDLAGLSQGQLAAAASGPVSFVLHRDAGDFRCTGVAGAGRGEGTCVYAASPDFPGALARRGVPGLTPGQQFQLAISDIGLVYVDELRRQAYATPSADDLVLAGMHGAGLNQLRAMDAVGYRFGDVATLVRVRDHGVSARYVEALRAAGYARLPAEQLVRLRDHGVSANFVADLHDHGYAGLTPDDLVHLRDHGVTASFVAELKAMGYDSLPPEQLARLRDHNVSAAFIRVANQGGGGGRLPPEDLIRLRDRGGRP